LQFCPIINEKVQTKKSFQINDPFGAKLPFIQVGTIIKMNNLPKIRTSNIVVQELADETLVYDLNANKAFCLNETSKLIWQHCDGKNSLESIASKLTKHFNKPVSEEIVYLAIEQFDSDELLENDTSQGFSQHFRGQSRREVIRKVGIGSMIALPIISSIVAPQAINAQSVAGVLGACTDVVNSSDCQPGLTCKATCQFNCAGSVCCRNSGTVTLGPGGPAGFTTDQNICDSSAAGRCCSGSGIINGNFCECV